VRITSIQLLIALKVLIGGKNKKIPHLVIKVHMALKWADRNKKKRGAALLGHCEAASPPHLRNHLVMYVFFTWVRKGKKGGRGISATVNGSI